MCICPLCGTVAGTFPKKMLFPSGLARVADMAKGRLYVSCGKGERQALCPNDLIARMLGRGGSRKETWDLTPFFSHACDMVCSCLQKLIHSEAGRMSGRHAAYSQK